MKKRDNDVKGKNDVIGVILRAPEVLAMGVIYWKGQV